MSFADLQMSAPAGDVCGVCENMSVDRYVACVAASCKPRLLNKMRLQLGTIGEPGVPIRSHHSVCLTPMRTKASSGARTRRLPGAAGRSRGVLLEMLHHGKPARPRNVADADAVDRMGMVHRGPSEPARVSGTFRSRPAPSARPHCRYKLFHTCGARGERSPASSCGRIAAAVETKGEFTYGATVTNLRLTIEHSEWRGDRFVIVDFPRVPANAAYLAVIDAERFVGLFLRHIMGVAAPRN